MLHVLLAHHASWHETSRTHVTIEGVAPAAATRTDSLRQCAAGRPNLISLTSTRPR